MPVALSAGVLLYLSRLVAFASACSHTPSVLPKMAFTKSPQSTHAALEPNSARVKGLTRQDEADMAEQGKRQRFNRNFGFISMLGFTTTSMYYLPVNSHDLTPTVMCTWEAVFFANFTAMINGGSPTLIYGFIFCFFGTLATAASLAEMASFAPTSGGQYHWVSMLAPKKYSNFLSWITGWIATLGWNANTAAGVFFSGTMIQGLLVLNYPSYDYQRWHGTLLMWAALLVCVFVNTVAARFLPKIEGVILILHTLGFFAILIPLVILAPKGSVDFVFKDFVNQAGWSSNGLAFFVGLISGNLPFVGTCLVMNCCFQPILTHSRLRWTLPHG